MHQSRFVLCIVLFFFRQEANCKNHKVNRVVFLGNMKRLLTTGVSRWNTRQIALWDQVRGRYCKPSGDAFKVRLYCRVPAWRLCCLKRNIVNCCKSIVWSAMVNQSQVVWYSKAGMKIRLPLHLHVKGIGYWAAKG